MEIRQRQQILPIKSDVGYLQRVYADAEARPTGSASSARMWLADVAGSVYMTEPVDIAINLRSNRRYRVDERLYRLDHNINSMPYH